MALTLTREIRFGLHEQAQTSTPPGAVNGFAGNPRLDGIAPFLKLIAGIAGNVDPVTGMMVNIKLVDKLLREEAVPRIREWHFSGMPVAPLMLKLWPALQARFVPHALASLELSPSAFLRFEILQKEPAVVRLSLRFEFSAAHRLHAAGLSAAENADVFGRCHNANGHGHNYEVEVVVSGAPDARGQVMELAALQATVNRTIIEPYDHKHLNLDCAEFGPGGLNPTVENIAAVLFKRLAPRVPAPAKLAALRVWETPKTMCEYTQD